MSNDKGILYVVATPIGNLGDITARACEVLAGADLLLAEDTRHSRRLLDKLGITTPLKSCHDFNERETTSYIITRLLAGEKIALISDAGTPLISDPGYHLVTTAHEQGVRVIPVPGPSAVIAALSVAGLPTDRFVFAGFAPERRAARRRCLATYAAETGTIIFYETPHRIMEFLQDAVDIFGANRLAVITRELTKIYETVFRDQLIDLLHHFEQHPDQRKGEFVVLIRGAEASVEDQEHEITSLLAIFFKHGIPLKQAVSITREINGGNKNLIYSIALELSEKQ